MAEEEDEDAEGMEGGDEDAVRRNFISLRFRLPQSINQSINQIGRFACASLYRA